VCQGFSYTSARSCAVPKLSPDGQRVAYVTTGPGSLCQSSLGMYWGTFVVVANRRGGGELARFEGYADPEWLPDGRLLMLGTPCRNAGVWIADAALKGPSRIDEDQVATPAGAPAVSPDGRTLAFVWNNQLWSMDLTGRPELTQLTLLPKSVSAAAWSPDGSALAVLQFDVSMPERSVVLMRPGDQSSVVVRPLPVYPYGPISWR
jgi:Tol biopolymer transport system component